MSSKKIFTTAGLLILSMAAVSYAKLANSQKTRPYIKATYAIPDALIPADALSTAEQSLSQLIYQGLFKINGRMEVVTDLAESWRYDSDRRIYRIRLKSKVSFHDNSQLLLSDVVESLQYLFTRSKHSHIYSNVLSVAGSGIDEIQIQLKEEQSYFLSLLAAPHAKIWKHSELSKFPLGTGPFIPEPQKVNGTLKLERFEGLVGSDKPLLKEIVLTEMSEAEMRSKLTRDLIDDSVDLPLSRPIESAPALKMLESPAAITWLIAFNTQNKILSRVENRRCLANLFDRKSFIKRFVPSHTEAMGYLPKSLPGSRVTSKIPESSCDGLVNKSLKLLVPRELEGAQEMCSFIPSQWHSSGLRVDCEVVDFDLLLKSVENKEHEMVLIGMSMDFPDVEYFLNTFERGSKFNLSNFKNDLVEELLRKSRRAKDKTERHKLYSHINDILYRDAVTLNISYPRYIAYASKCVEGLDLNVAGVAYTDYSAVYFGQLCHE